MAEEVIRKPLMTGHCAHFARNTETGKASHDRCHRQGGGQRANPKREFQPCPCICHYENEDGTVNLYECGECGKPIVEALLWPYDEDGDVRYTHIDFVLNDAGEITSGSGRATGENCEDAAPPRREVSQTRERDCTRCGEEFMPKGRERICPECRAAEIEEAQAEIDEFSDLDVDENGDPIDEADALMAEMDAWDDED